MAPEVKSELSVLIWKGSKSWGDARIGVVVTAILRHLKASCSLVPQFQA